MDDGPPSLCATDGVGLPTELPSNASRSRSSDLGGSLPESLGSSATPPDAGGLSNDRSDGQDIQDHTGGMRGRPYRLTHDAIRKTRAQYWVFTWNNYPEDADDLLKHPPDAFKYSYLVYGREVAPTTGTPHLQGAIRFEERVRGSSLEDKWLKIWWHPKAKNSTNAEWSMYAKKDANFVEIGDLPPDPHVEGAAKRKEFFDDLKQKAKDRRLDELEADQIPHYKTFKSWADEYFPVAVQKLPPGVSLGLWIYGPTGIGKTTRILDYFEEKHLPLYQKGLHKWWDQYKYEKYVLIDEWSPFNIALTADLKLWANNAPAHVEIKGGALKIRPRFIIITSNHSIDDCFFNSRNPHDTTEIDCMKRRFQEFYCASMQDVLDIDLDSLIPL